MRPSAFADRHRLPKTLSVATVIANAMLAFGTGNLLLNLPAVVLAQAGVARHSSKSRLAILIMAKFAVALLEYGQ